MQASTHRDQCTLVGSIYRDAHVLELDNKACISTVQHSTVQYSTVQHSTVQYSTVQYSTVLYCAVQYKSINKQANTHRDQCTLVGSIHRDAYVLEPDNRHE